VNAAATQGLSDEEVAAFMRITGTVIQNLAGDTAGNDLSTPREPEGPSSATTTRPRHHQA
jgi:hypothetical protein